MTTTQRYDAIVIGAGQAGVPLSRTLAKAGWKTASGSHLLAAAGRVPNTDRLNLAAAGVETDEWGFRWRNR